MQSREKRILVVDDDPAILLFLRAMLEDEGYTVVTTDKGEYVEGLHDGGLPHFIILDMLLSGKDGREIARHIKSREETKHIPILMISAHPLAEQEALAAGADDFLAKPFEMDDLLAKVAKYLA
jgi:CheY-like chemotaxis protein